MARRLGKVDDGKEPAQAVTEEILHLKGALSRDGRHP